MRISLDTKAALPWRNMFRRTTYLEENNIGLVSGFDDGNEFSRSEYRHRQFEAPSSWYGLSVVFKAASPNKLKMNRRLTDSIREDMCWFDLQQYK